MSKSVCGLHGLSTKKSTMTKVKARQHVHIMSNYIKASYKVGYILELTHLPIAPFSVPRK